MLLESSGVLNMARGEAFIELFQRLPEREALYIRWQFCRAVIVFEVARLYWTDTGRTWGRTNDRSRIKQSQTFQPGD